MISFSLLILSLDNALQEMYCSTTKNLLWSKNVISFKFTLGSSLFNYPSLFTSHIVQTWTNLIISIKETPNSLTNLLFRPCWLKPSTCFSISVSCLLSTPTPSYSPPKGTPDLLRVPSPVPGTLGTVKPHGQENPALSVSWLTWLGVVLPRPPW